MKIDNEFKTLIPPLTAEEYQGLEKSILAEGCRDSLIVWHDTLIDGHNRYEICTKHGIPYKTTSMEFESREKVIEWIILNQFGRRNLPAHERARLALRLKPVIAEKAKENLVTHTETGYQGLQNSAMAVDTRQELAKVAGVSHDTITKVEKIESDAPAPIIEASRKGEISVNAAYQVTKFAPEEKAEISTRINKGETPKEVIKEIQKRPHVSFNSGNNEWYTPKSIIEAAIKVMGEITLDPATSELANKTVNAKNIFTAEDNGLEKPWSGNVWLNPPYSADLIGQFAEKAVKERPNYEQIIVLVNNATETEWFNKFVSIATAVCFPRSRVKFYKPDGNIGAPLQGQAIIYCGSKDSLFVETFKEIGWCAYLNDI
jgi:phage N-6-adenine-methyltransferase